MVVVVAAAVTVATEVAVEATEVAVEATVVVTGIAITVTGRVHTKPFMAVNTIFLPHMNRITSIRMFMTLIIMTLNPKHTIITKQSTPIHTRSTLSTSICIKLIGKFSIVFLYKQPDFLHGLCMNNYF